MQIVNRLQIIKARSNYILAVKNTLYKYTSKFKNRKRYIMQTLIKRQLDINID